MGEAVALVSVAASAAVGVGGLVAAAWGGSRERRWRSREERTIDLRAALEEGSQSLANALFKSAEIHRELDSIQGLSPDHKDVLIADRKRLALASNRIGVRCGSTSAEYISLLRCIAAFARLMGLLEEASTNGLSDKHKDRYFKALAEAGTAESAYLDATAKTLAWRQSVPPPWRKTMLARPARRSSDGD